MLRSVEKVEQSGRFYSLSVFKGFIELNEGLGTTTNELMLQKKNMQFEKSQVELQNIKNSY